MRPNYQIPPFCRTVETAACHLIREAQNLKNVALVINKRLEPHEQIDADECAAIADFEGIRMIAYPDNTVDEVVSNWQLDYELRNTHSEGNYNGHARNLQKRADEHVPTIDQLDMSDLSAVIDWIDTLMLCYNFGYSQIDWVCIFDKFEEAGYKGDRSMALERCEQGSDEQARRFIEHFLYVMMHDMAFNQYDFYTAEVHPFAKKWRALQAQKAPKVS